MILHQDALMSLPLVPGADPKLIRRLLFVEELIQLRTLQDGQVTTLALAVTSRLRPVEIIVEVLVDVGVGTVEFDRCRARKMFYCKIWRK